MKKMVVNQMHWCMRAEVIVCSFHEKIASLQHLNYTQTAFYISNCHSVVFKEVWIDIDKHRLERIQKDVKTAPCLPPTWLGEECCSILFIPRKASIYTLQCWLSVNEKVIMLLRNWANQVYDLVIYCVPDFFFSLKKLLELNILLDLFL